MDGQNRPAVGAAIILLWGLFKLKEMLVEHAPMVVEERPPTPLQQTRL
jgi:hypothetical protein